MNYETRKNTGISGVVELMERKEGVRFTSNNNLLKKVKQNERKYFGRGYIKGCMGKRVAPWPDEKTKFFFLLLLLAQLRAILLKLAILHLLFTYLSSNFCNWQNPLLFFQVVSAQH